MRYIFRLNARSTEDVPIAEKHAKLVGGLMSIAGDWGLEPVEYPAPDPGRELSAQFQLGKRLRSRGVRGFVNYRFRGGLREDSACDDYIDLDFNPERVDFGGLIAALPKYVAAFEPYFGYVADEEFTFLDFNRSLNANYRISVLRVYPVCYLSRGLCTQALGLSLGEVASRFGKKARSVIVVENGAIIIGHTEPIPFVAARALSDELSGSVGVMLSA
jgi:hypothetical protein